MVRKHSYPIFYFMTIGSLTIFNMLQLITFQISRTQLFPGIVAAKRQHCF
jgi:hypothetical protein